MSEQAFNPQKFADLKNTINSDVTLAKLLIFGDWHLTDKNSAAHIDYEQDCYDYMREAKELVEEHTPDLVAHSGDLAGRDNDKNVLSREFQAYMHIWFNQINRLVDYEQYATAGNHDEGKRMTEFEYFKMVGAFKTVDHIDLEGIRLHFVNYGDEDRPLDLAEGKYNIVLAHNEFHIERKTDWFFNSTKGRQLSAMKHWKGVDFVACGHIHHTSSEVLETSIDDHPIRLFYMGCPTRPDAGEKQRVSRPLLFKVTPAGVDLEIIEWKLKEKVFKHEEQEDKDKILELLENFSTTKEGSERLQNREELSETLSTLTRYMVVGNNDFVTQLELLGSIDKEALELAKSVLSEVQVTNSGVGHIV